MNRGALYATNFIANAAVLVFEIAGARMMAPYLGTSTEVWAGLIAVVLGGLALGYWLGGRLAGAHPTPTRLVGLLFGAAGGALVTWSLRDIVPLLLLTSVPALSLTAYAVLIGAILFIPTTVLLGAVSPYAARLALRDLDSAASVIGTFSAVGALGSIAGAIATGMILLPSLGLGTIVIGVAATLALTAIFLGAASRKIMLIGALCVLGGAGITAATPPALGDGIVADIDTPYQRVWIGEIRGSGGLVRYVRTDPFGTQCAMFIDESGPRADVLVFEYLKGFFISDVAVPNPERVLMIGGCNYSFPRAFLTAHPDVDITVVELDPGMTKIAQEWFGLSETPGFSIVHADGRVALNRKEVTYDVIFVDAFTSFSTIPHQLTTMEAAALLKDATGAEGIVVLNVIGALEGPAAAFPAALYRTLGESFPSIAVYHAEENALAVTQNLIFVARAEAHRELPRAVALLGASFERVPDAALQALRNEGVLLTDEYAPVEKITKPLRDAWSPK